MLINGRVFCTTCTSKRVIHNWLTKIIVLVMKNSYLSELKYIKSYHFDTYSKEWDLFISFLRKVFYETNRFCISTGTVLSAIPYVSCAHLNAPHVVLWVDAQYPIVAVPFPLMILIIVISSSLITFLSPSFVHHIPKWSCFVRWSLI